MKTKEFFLSSYLPTLEEVQQVLDTKANQIERYAYILHDKDYYTQDVIDKDTGEILHKANELKQPHIHIYLKTFNSRQPEEVSRWFEKKDSEGRTIHCLRQIVRDRVNCIKYLIHDTKSSKQKYQYPIESVVSYNIDDIESEEPIDNTYYIVQDLIQGIPPMEMLRKYGRDFIYHIQAYKEFLTEVDKYNFYVNSVNNNDNCCEDLEITNEDLPFP